MPDNATSTLNVAENETLCVVNLLLLENIMVKEYDLGL